MIVRNQFRQEYCGPKRKREMDQIEVNPVDSKDNIPRIKVKPLHTLTMQRIKSKHANMKQREKMVEVILKNPDLFRGRKGVRAVEKWKKAWEDLTVCLNTLGPPRKLHLWHKMWKNMIARVREKQTAITKEAKRNKGDPRAVEPLTEMEEEILRFIKFCRVESNLETAGKVLKTYPGRIKPTKSTARNPAETPSPEKNLPNGAPSDNEMETADAADTETYSIESPEPHTVASEMGIQLVRTYPGYTKPIDALTASDTPPDLNLSEEQSEDLDPMVDHLETESSSIQSPQPSTSACAPEIDIISPANLIPDEKPQTEKDLLAEIADLRQENTRLQKQVEFFQREFSKITDIFHHVVTERTKK